MDIQRSKGKVKISFKINRPMKIKLKNIWPKTQGTYNSRDPNTKIKFTIWYILF